MTGEGNEGSRPAVRCGASLLEPAKRVGGPDGTTDFIPRVLRTNNETPCVIRVSLTQRDQSGKPDINGFSLIQDETGI
jgi:hypothetical protein